MYRQVTTDPVATDYNGENFKPVATLASKSGGRCQISIDDHCYVLSLQQPDGTYRWINHIFLEAFLVLKELPPPE